LFCFNIRQHGRQILCFELHWTAANVIIEGRMRPAAGCKPPFIYVVLWFSVAVHFISEPTKFELIITIFEHNDVYLSPTLRIKVLL